MDIRTMAIAERAELATLLESLSPQHWDQPTLCDGWRVRELAAHVVSYDELTPAELARRFARGRLSGGRVNNLGVAEYAERAPADLVALLRDERGPRGLPAALGCRIALTDALMHHQDIRRPLGMPREVPTDRLAAALSMARVAPPIGGFWRARGLRLVATDLDWAAGRGPEVRGLGEPLLMALGGRRGAVQQLSGPGQQTLADRIGG